MDTESPEPISNPTPALTPTPEPVKSSNRKKYMLFGGIGVAAVIVISLVTWALLKAYAPVKTTVASTTQTPSTQQGTSSTTPVSTTAIVPVATTNAAVDNLQTLLQNDSSDDAATGTALNDNQQQVTVPTE